MRRLLALLMLAAIGGAQAALTPADLVLEHGTVLTLDTADHAAQAIAVRDGRIVAVGSDADMAPLIGPHTKVIDLKGRTATPGLIDTHAHILQGGLIELFGIDLTRTTKLADLLDQVRAKTGAAEPGAWVQGSGWNDGILAERRPPTKAELDAVSGGHPVTLEHVSGHFAMVNSAALALMHVTKDTKEPAGGTIERDAQGNATGIFKENAQALVTAAIPPPSLAQRQAAIRAMIDKMHAEGMTGVKDPHLTPDEWASYLDLARHKSLDAHVCALIGAGTDMAGARTALAAVKQARKDVATLADLNICGVKIFMDGALTAHTAWLLEDYPTDAAHPVPDRGYPTVPPDTYRQMIDLFTREGVAVGTHVIGDRGLDFVIDTYAQALAKAPRMGLRHTLIHASLPSEHALEAIAQVQHRYDSGIVETQSEFLWALGGVLPRVLPPALLARGVPLADFAKRGIIYSSSSDFPVTPLPARYGLWASVAREPVNPVYGQHPFGTAQAATVQAALRSYTLSAAHAMYLEKQTGSLETGKWADIAVWDINPYAAPTAALKDMRCEMTFYKGRQVFAR